MKKELEDALNRNMDEYAKRMDDQKKKEVEEVEEAKATKRFYEDFRKIVKGKIKPTMKAFGKKLKKGITYDITEDKKAHIVMMLLHLEMPTPTKYPPFLAFRAEKRDTIICNPSGQDAKEIKISDIDEDWIEKEISDFIGFVLSKKPENT